MIRSVAGAVRDLARVETYIERQAALPEYVTIRRLEGRMGEAGVLEWTEKSNTVIARLLAAAPETLTEAFLSSAPGRLIDGFGTWPSEDLTGMMDDLTRETYRLSAQVIARKAAGAEQYQKILVFRQAEVPAEIVPSFDTADVAAMDYLSESQVFWMRQHFDTDTVNAIRAAGWVELEGLSGKEAGRRLRRLAERQFGVGTFAAFTDAYFEGTAVNAATTARVVGSVYEMRDIGIEFYQVIAVMDERTTPICEHMDGKRFPVDAGASRMDDIVATGDPNGVRDLHPWRPNTFRTDLANLGVNIQVGTPLSNTDALKAMNAGFGFPPYHFKCRTTVDIA